MSNGIRQSNFEELSSIMAIECAQADHFRSKKYQFFISAFVIIGSVIGFLPDGASKGHIVAFIIVIFLVCFDSSLLINQLNDHAVHHEKNVTGIRKIISRKRPDLSSVFDEADGANQRKHLLSRCDPLVTSLFLAGLLAMIFAMSKLPEQV